MSRSRRKTPIVGHTTCGSEREDKKLWHQRWRTRERTALTSASPEALSAHLPLLENQASSVWSMGKDGRSYWPVKRQAATADRIANHKGRNPQERASLKKRLLTLWFLQNISTKFPDTCLSYLADISVFRFLPARCRRRWPAAPGAILRSVSLNKKTAFWRSVFSSWNGSLSPDSSGLASVRGMIQRA